MTEKKELTFWDHLEELRKVIFRVLIATCIFMVVAFLCKEMLFSVILAPHRSDFVIYRLLCCLGDVVSFPALCPDAFHVDLINIQLASQFMIHLKMSFYIGLLVALPYTIYQLYLFIAPALHQNEKQYSGRVILFSILLFLLGVLLNYFVIFPLSFRFLATYQVSSEVTNIISLPSYIDTFVMLSLMLGIISELPVVSWLLAKLGILNDGFMKKYRRHAIVFILIIAAIITPTADVFTLMLVFIPIYFLYELSILIVKKSVKKEQKRILMRDEESWKNPYDLGE